MYVTLDSKIKCLSLAFLFLATLPINETGNAYTWGTTNSKPRGPIIVVDQSEILSRSGAIYYTLFGRCLTVLRLLPASASCTNLVRKNQFRELNWHILTFSQ